MTAKQVKLYGGPFHGETRIVPPELRVLFVIQPITDINRLFQEDVTEPASIETRQGRYSEVSGRRDEFEWDGWVG